MNNILINSLAGQDLSKVVALIGWHEGSAGIVHSWLEKSSELKILCFVHPEDDFPKVEKIKRASTLFSYPENGQYKGLPLICSSQWFNELKKLGVKKVLVTTTDPIQRALHINLAKNHQFELINAIHPSVVILEEAKLGQNIILHAGCLIGYKAEIGDGVFVNTRAQIDHHCVIESNVTIDPGVVMAGNVHIQSGAIIHTGAVIKNKIEINKNSIVGAGSVVIKDVPEGVTVVGVPAKKILRKL